jgi:formylglycine-generating enzyme required for sulfatase activity
MYDNPTLKEEIARLAGLGRRLLTPSEWEYACGGGSTTLFRWGHRYLEGTNPHSAGLHREPNFFGLLIGQDPYRDERTSDRNVICGGDGGSMVCGGSGEFVEWLTIATAYRDVDYVKFMQEEGGPADAGSAGHSSGLRLDIGCRSNGCRAGGSK